MKRRSRISCRCLEPESEQTAACLYALGATYARVGRPRARTRVSPESAFRRDRA